MKTNLVESSLGIKTTEGMARRLDELLPTLPAELRTLRHKSTTESDVPGTASPRTDVSVITTSVPDRDSEIVLPDGINLEDYRANPIVLFGHNQDTPCGKCLWVKATDEGLIAKTFYPARPSGYQGEWLPDYVYNLVVADVLRGKSIGFLPLEMREPTPEETALYPDVNRVITKSLLVEYSCVSCPSNPKALVAAINKGLTNLERLGGKVIGKAKKPVVKHYHASLPPITFDPAKIADEVVRNILKRWEA